MRKKKIQSQILEFHLDGRATIDGKPWTGGVVNAAQMEHLTILAPLMADKFLRRNGDKWTIDERKGERRKVKAETEFRVSDAHGETPVCIYWDGPPWFWRDDRRSGKERRK